MKTFLEYAFRPFFLLNGLFAILMMMVWIMALHGEAAFSVATVLWHGHEMLVGFSMATIAGFILTAVATWTGRPPLSGARLGLLVLAWLAGRAAMMIGYPVWPVPAAFVDVLFPVLLCFFVAQEVIGGASQRNFPIIFIMALMAVLDILYHLGALGVMPGADRIAVYLFIHLVLLLITVIGGRIIPSFTANWLRAKGVTRLPKVYPLLDKVVIALMVLTGISASFAPDKPWTGILAFATALAHAARLAGWCGLSTRGEPLLFVLHVAYLWLPVGYALTGLAVFGQVLMPTAALHALTMGAVGMMILAVTTRVALAHTGRPLRAARLTVVAYWIFTAAVLTRVLGTMSDHYLAMVDLSAMGWIIAFVIFSWVYWPVLTKPRVD
jgi:uncharacterized protein involved in response to NO